jgi:hypothetical protein
MATRVGDFRYWGILDMLIVMKVPKLLLPFDLHMGSPRYR